CGGGTGACCMSEAGAPPRVEAAINGYALVPATSVDPAALLAFAAAIWPELDPQARVRAFWWRRAGPEQAVAAVARDGGAMAGLCGRRPCVVPIGRPTLPAPARSHPF